MTPVARPWWLLPTGRVHAAWWYALAVVAIGLDLWQGPGVDFPAVYVIPVALAAWYSSRRPALVITAAVVLVQAWDVAQGPAAGRTLEAVMVPIRAGVIGVMGLWFARLSEYERQVQRYVGDLEGLLPICAICKSIRNESGDWEKLERFISARSRADFSHGVCPDCMRRHYPEP